MAFDHTLRTKLISAILAILGVLFLAAFSWPTPTSTPSPFVGVTAIATPIPGPPLYPLQMCFQDNAGSVQCGLATTLVKAGDVVSTGISAGPPVAGVPQGPFPSTVNLTVNGVTYSNVPVGANGLIGAALLNGFQILTISVGPTANLLGASGQVQTY